MRNNFATPDKDKRAADVQHVREWVEAAARLGAPVLRIFAGAETPNQNWDESAEWVVKALKKCVEHGQKYGVLIGIQNHWDWLKTSEQVLKIVKMVDSEWFGVIVDTGYFLTPDPYKDIAAVAPPCRQLAGQGKSGRPGDEGQDGPEEDRADRPGERLSRLPAHRDALQKDRGTRLRSTCPGRGAAEGTARSDPADGVGSGTLE